jgi:hypothetical protein
MEKPCNRRRWITDSSAWPASDSRALVVKYYPPIGLTARKKFAAHGNSQLASIKTGCDWGGGL